jgi:hypothetical protein
MQLCSCAVMSKPRNLRGKFHEDPDRIEDPDRSVRRVGAVVQLAEHNFLDKFV